MCRRRHDLPLHAEHSGPAHVFCTTTRAGNGHCYSWHKHRQATSNPKATRAEALTPNMPGAIIFLAAFEQLLPQVGFGWTTRIMAFIVLALQVLPILVLRKRITSTPKRALLDTTALKEPAFVIVMVHMTIAYAGFFIPFYYIEVFAESQPAIASQAAYLSKYLIIVISASSLPARVVSRAHPTNPTPTH